MCFKELADERFFLKSSFKAVSKFFSQTEFLSFLNDLKTFQFKSAVQEFKSKGNFLQPG